MKTTHKINIDLLTPGLRSRVCAVQDDSCTREVQISLYSGGVSWSPAGAAAAVGYSKSDGTVGLYDTLPDGSKAVSISGNTVTVILAAQMLTAAGTVEAAVTLADSSGNQLTTFAFDVIVAANPGNSAVKSEDYFNYVNPKFQEVIAQAAVATAAANAAADRANAASAVAYEANAKVDTLREVVSKFHSNIVEEASGEVITLSDASDLELAGLKVFGKTTQNGIPTPESPVALESLGDGGSVGITVVGKNLLDSSQLQPSTIMKYYQMKLKPNVVYTLSTNLPKTYNDDDSAYLFIISGMNTSGLSTNGHGAWDGQNRTVTPDSDGIVTVCYRADNTNVSSFDGYQIQLEYGSTATAYEAYKENQSLPMTTFAETALSSGNPLAGIPVTSGGNYTDENSQQWLCDEVDFEKGVYVQRVVNTAAFTAGKTENGLTLYTSSIGVNTKGGSTNYSICNVTNLYRYSYTWDSVHYYVSTDSTVLVWLPESFDATATPINALVALAGENFIDLSADELAQYAALHTNYPNTTVYNDAGAHMKLQYVADTKLYVDKKFAELAQALVSST